MRETGGSPFVYVQVHGCHYRHDHQDTTREASPEYHFFAASTADGNPGSC